MKTILSIACLLLFTGCMHRAHLKTPAIEDHGDYFLRTDADDKFTVLAYSEEGVAHAKEDLCTRSHICAEQEQKATILWIQRIRK